MFRNDRGPAWRQRAKPYFLAALVFAAVMDCAYPWLCLGAARVLPLSRLLSLSPHQVGLLVAQSVKVTFYASFVLVPLAAGILLGKGVRNRGLRWILSLVLGWSVCALNAWAVGWVSEGLGAPKKEHGLYRLGTDERGATYAFSRYGPTFHVPLHWSPTDPAPQEAAHLVRDDSGEAVARCWFNIFNDHRYRGLSGEQILARFQDPRTFRELADTASLAAFDKLTLDGLPAYRSSWTSIGTHRGIQVPIRIRVVTLAYKTFAISSACMASEFDSKVLAHELDDIQLSFRASAREALPERSSGAAPVRGGQFELMSE
jgi:hypothetical protein